MNSGGSATSELICRSASQPATVSPQRWARGTDATGLRGVDDRVHRRPHHLRAQRNTPQPSVGSVTAPAMISGTTTQGCRCSPKARNLLIVVLAEEICAVTAPEPVPSRRRRRPPGGWLVDHQVQPQTRQRLRQTRPARCLGMRGRWQARHQSARQTRRVRGSVPDRLSRRSTHDRGRGGAQPDALTLISALTWGFVWVGTTQVMGRSTHRPWCRERLSVLPMTTTTSHQQIPTTSSARATQVVHRPGYVGAPAGSRTSHVRRDAEAARRREEALARLTARSMPLPGRPMPGRTCPVPPPALMIRTIEVERDETRSRRYTWHLRGDLGS